MDAERAERALRGMAYAIARAGKALGRAIQKAGEVAEECPRCDGTGEVPLLTSVRTCQMCEGVGVVLPMTEE